MMAGSTITLNCSGDCVTDFLKCYGDVIFYIAVSVIPALLLFIIALLIALCCCYRKRKSSIDGESIEGRKKTNSGKKGDAFQMVEIGEVGEKSKAKVTDRAEDTKLENLAEAMYATVDYTQDQYQPSSNSQTKQASNTDQMMDDDNYDIITHVGKDDSAQAGISIITQQDGKRNGSMSDIRSSNYRNGQQRGRTRSPLEEPPPLPPPFVEEETPAINSANKGLQSSITAASKQQKFNDIDLGGLYGNTCACVNAVQEELILYDDPATTEPQQEKYMNVGKR